MKKILFTLLLIAGTFTSQAQIQDGDYIRSFRFANAEGDTQNRTHYYGDSFDHCPSNLANPGIVVELTFDRGTRQLYIKNGDEGVVSLGSPLSSRQGIGLSTTFDRTDLSQVFITGSRGQILSEITGFTTN